MISFFAILSIINIPILVPIHYFSMGNLEDDQEEHYQQTFTTTSELDKWTMSNLSQNSSNRLICHLFLSIFVVLWFHLILSSELRYVNQLGYSVLTKSKYQNILYLEGLSKNWYPRHIVGSYFRATISWLRGYDLLYSKRFKKSSQFGNKIK